jgi:hypothetical protein
VTLTLALVQYPGNNTLADITWAKYTYKNLPWSNYLFKDYPNKGALGKIDCGKLTLEISSLASPRTKIILLG